VGCRHSRIRYRERPPVGRGRWVSSYHVRHPGPPCHRASGAADRNGDGGFKPIAAAGSEVLTQADRPILAFVLRGPNRI
jgi:hypothetical protein